MAGIKVALGMHVKNSKAMSEIDVEKGKSSFRGHPIVWKNERWLYADSMEPLPGWGGEARPCKACGSTEWSGSDDGDYPDECLGNLPGATNACCGHGDRERSYIAFPGGVILRGFYVSKM